MNRYSIFSLVRNALSYHERWEAAWRSPEPKPDYDVVIVGGGGHGLATAYYLAKRARHHQCRGAREGLARRRQHRAQHHDRALQLPVGRERAALRAFAEALGGALARSSTSTSCSASAACSTSRHSQQDMRDIARRVNANRLNGIDAEMLDAEQVKAMVPIINCVAGRALSRSSARRCSGAAAPRATTRSPGAMRAAPTPAASTSSRTAR